MTQVLTLKTVKRKAREAYKARRLTAQHRDQVQRECLYVADDYRCAIGAALFKTTIQKMADETANQGNYLNEMDVGYVVEAEVVSIRAGDEDAIGSIQSAHDEWAKASKDKGATSSKAQNARRAFLKLIAA